ncbi:MAG: HNH endonuclease [Myxococcales bacterium]|nr:HNH endonuclease [Myxococcales bacterium]
MGYIGNTDKNWFEFLRAQANVEEVNFWQPGTLRNFRAVEPGSPFFLRLKAPHRAIGGMGFFSRYVQTPVAMAWETFGPMNGAVSLGAMRNAIGRYRQDLSAAGTDEIGCILLFHPVFFPDWLWIPQPTGWQDSIVSGARIDIDIGEGKRIFEACMERVLMLHDESPLPVQDSVVAAAKFGAPYEVTPRLGQGAFRLSVTAAYGRSCAISGEHSLPVLDAAHIRPYAGEGDHRVSNGLLLRTDIHRLFDKGYVTVTEDLHFEVSARLREEFANGKIYYALHGSRIRVPAAPADRPDAKLLLWHNENTFEHFD